MFDVLIRHATVIDGARTPRFSADIVITGDRIDSIGDLTTDELVAAGQPVPADRVSRSLPGRHLRCDRS